jgi:hypothetical protein
VPRPKIKLNSAGIAAMLQSDEVSVAVTGLAESVMANVALPAPHNSRMDVEVDSYTTDRAASAVTIAHAGGLGVEAKYGVLGRAAAAAGLQVRRR